MGVIIKMSWYKMERGWQDSSFFKDEPYTERDAWAWIIGEARFKETTISSPKGKPVKVARGQLYTSIRFMSIKFKWSKDKVSRYLKRLKKWSMIQVETETGQNLISICNYSEYQDECDTSKDEGKDAPKDKQEECNKKVKKVNNIYNIKPELWSDFKKHRNKKKAPITETAMNGIIREAEKANWTLEKAITEICERGWTGFKADWVLNNNNNSAKPKGTFTNYSDSYPEGTPL